MELLLKTSQLLSHLSTLALLGTASVECWEVEGSSFGVPFKLLYVLYVACGACAFSSLQDGKLPIDFAPDEALVDIFSALKLGEDSSALQCDSQCTHVISQLQ